MDDGSALAQLLPQNACRNLPAKPANSMAFLISSSWKAFSGGAGGAAGLWYEAPLVYDESKMSVASPVYFEIVDFIAAGTTPETVIDFQPSLEAQQRLAALIELKKADTLSPEEGAELDHFMELEHILRMAKARARQILSRGE